MSIASALARDDDDDNDGDFLSVPSIARFLAARRDSPR